jgi:hypothetical protein
MNRSNEISDPFARHRKAENQPEPVQAQPAVEAVETGLKSTTEAPTVEPRPVTKSVERKPLVRAANPFAQHTNKTERRPRPARAQVPPAERLMAWLPRWPKATISVRDVRLYGPNSLRNPEVASAAIEVLASYGWLIPVMTRQHNMEWWQIVRGRDQAVASPGVAEP